MDWGKVVLGSGIEAGVLIAVFFLLNMIVGSFFSIALSQAQLLAGFLYLTLAVFVKNWAVKQFKLSA